MIRPAVSCFIGAVLLVGAIQVGSTANAQRACVGSISASTLGAVTPNMPVAIVRSRETTPENNELRGAFEQGFREAGGVVDSKAPAQMIVAYLLHGPAGSPAANQTFATLSALAQAIHAQTGNPTVTLTVTLANFPPGTVIWVGSVVCHIQTRNFVILAHDLGGLIARNLGRSMKDEAIQ